MKHALLVVVMVVGLVAAFGALSAKAPAPPIEMQTMDVGFEAAVDQAPEVLGVGVQDVALALPQPLSLAQLALVNDCDTHAAQTIAIRSERHDLPKLDSHDADVAPPYKAKEIRAVLPAWIRARDHAPC